MLPFVTSSSLGYQPAGSQAQPERRSSSGDGGGSQGGDDAEAAGDEEAPSAPPSEPDAAEAAAEGGEEAPLEWRHCMDDLGASNKLCSEALERVMRACPGSAQLLWGSGGEHRSTESSFLPFLADTL